LVQGMPVHKSEWVYNTPRAQRQYYPSPERQAAMPARAGDDCEAAAIHFALIKGVTPTQVERAKEHAANNQEAVIFKYDLPHAKPNSREVNRGKLQEHFEVVKLLIPLGIVNKTVFCEGLSKYYQSIGVQNPCISKIMDQAWALKRMVADVASVKKNATTGARLPGWIKDLIELVPNEALTMQSPKPGTPTTASSNAKALPLSNPSTPEPTVKRRALFRIGSTPPSIKALRKPMDETASEADVESEEMPTAGQASPMFVQASPKPVEDEDEDAALPWPTNSLAKPFWSEELGTGVVVGTNGSSQLSSRNSNCDGFVQCLFIKNDKAKLDANYIWQSEEPYLGWQLAHGKTPSPIAMKAAAKKTPEKKKKAKGKAKIAKSKGTDKAKAKIAKTKGKSKKRGAFEDLKGDQEFLKAEWKRQHSIAYCAAKKISKETGKDLDTVRAKMIAEAKAKFINEYKHK
jgi:hypothetical protein